MRRKLTQQDVARALGISPAMVSRLKKRGMPVHSVAAAAAWRREHLDPTLVKAVRERLALPPPDPVEVARNLAALAANEPARWLTSLRDAMRAIPPARREELELDVATWDALLEPFEAVLAECAQAPDGATPARDAPPEDDELEHGLLLYQLACGELVLADPA